MSAGIKIKSVRKAAPRIKIRRRFLSASDLRSLTSNVLRLNDFVPLRPSTIKDIFDKSASYLSGQRMKSNPNSNIKIKRIRLVNKQNKYFG